MTWQPDPDTGPSGPLTQTSGDPARLSLYEVVTLNADGTIDARQANSRTSKHSIPVPAGHAPQIGDRIILAHVDGDNQRPRMLAFADNSLGGVLLTRNVNSSGQSSAQLDTLLGKTNGLIARDDTNGLLLLRTGGKWHSASLTLIP